MMLQEPPFPRWDPLPMRVRPFMTIIDSEVRRRAVEALKKESAGEPEIDRLDDDHGIVVMNVKRTIVDSWDSSSIDLRDFARGYFWRMRPIDTTK